MNREQAKELLPIIQAFAEGKTIQVKGPDNRWYDYKNKTCKLNFNSDPQSYYPILINVEIRGEQYENSCNMSEMFKNYTFADGTPFGIKEE